MEPRPADGGLRKRWMLARLLMLGFPGWWRPRQEHAYGQNNVPAKLSAVQSWMMRSGFMINAKVVNMIRCRIRIRLCAL